MNIKGLYPGNAPMCIECCPSLIKRIDNVCGIGNSRVLIQLNTEEEGKIRHVR